MSEMSQTINHGFWSSGVNRTLPSRGFVLLMAGLATTALSVSGYLAFTSLTSGTVAGCSGSLFDCDSVLKSRWSTWLGIPVSLLAALTYIGLLLALAGTLRGSARSQSIAWMLATTLCLSAGVAAVWFISLQVFVLEHLCKYCLVAHSCGLILTTMILVKKPLGYSTMKIPAFLAATGFAALVVGQSLGPKPQTFTIEEYVSSPQEASESGDVFSAPASEGLLEGEIAPPEDDFIFEPPSDAEVSQTSGIRSLLFSTLASSSCTSVVSYVPLNDGDPSRPQQSAGDEHEASVKKAKARRLVAMPGNMKLEIDRWPMIGKSDAKFVFVEIFDYSCPHCRSTHRRAIKGARERLNDELAVITLPLPLNTQCNPAIAQTGPKFAESCEIAKLAVAVWKVDKEKFQEFHNWMFSGDAPRYAAAKQKAETLVDAGKLAQVLASKLPSSYVNLHVQIYEKLGKGNVPKLIFPRRAIVGEFTSPDSLVSIIREEGPTPMPKVAND
jgi:uncharacterized membrane protein/protein-disulfide isomerase